MTEQEMIVEFKRRTDETSDTVAATFISDAKSAIIDHIYPFGDGSDSLPTRYQSRQLAIAVYLYNKQGAEGETRHNENGIDRTYESADIPSSMFRGIPRSALIPAGGTNEST